MFREIKRGEVILSENGKEIKRYSAMVSEEKYQAQLKRRGSKYKIDKNVELAELIEETIIKKKYSPEATIMYISKHYPEVYKDGLCVGTLYRCIDKGMFPNLTNQHLPVKGNRAM